MNKYIVDYEREFENAREVTDYILEESCEIEELYDEMLDEVYGEVEICGYSYSSSRALYLLDEIAYNCGKNDYIDSLTSDLEYEIENLGQGEQEAFYGFTVEIKANEFEDFCNENICSDCKYCECKSVEECERKFCKDEN